MGIQTVFEGHSINTEEKLHKNQIKYNLQIPMAHAGGEQEPHQIPKIMRDYRSGGTPWTVIIDPSGKVVFNNFHIDVDPAIALIEKLRLQKKSHLIPFPKYKNSVAVVVE